MAEHEYNVSRKLFIGGILDNLKISNLHKFIMASDLLTMKHCLYFRQMMYMSSGHSPLGVDLPPVLLLNKRIWKLGKSEKS